MNTAFGNRDSINDAVVDVAYKQSFGNMPSGTVYSDGMRCKGADDYGFRGKLEKKITAALTKDVLTTSSEYASGLNYSAVAGNLPILIPIYVDKAIIDLVRRETPLYELLAKKAIKSKFYDWNTMTARNAAQWLPESAALAVQDDTYTRNIVPMKYAYAVGKVTGPAIAGMQGYIDILREQAQTHTQSLVQLIENEIINGSIAVNANGFNGLILNIVTNVQALAGAAITIPILRTAIRQAKSGSIVAAMPVGGGNPNLFITDVLTIDQVKALLQAWLTYPAPNASLAWGIQTVEFEGIPFITSKFMTTLAANKTILLIDTSKVFLAVLQDIVMEQLARTDDATKFMIKWYGALIVTAETHCAEINTIA